VAWWLVEYRDNFNFNFTFTLLRYTLLIIYEFFTVTLYFHQCYKTVKLILEYYVNQFQLINLYNYSTFLNTWL
jgi:hypothetical protein